MDTCDREVMAYVATTAQNQRVDGMFDWRSLAVHGTASVLRNEAEHRA
jgi:hypothetical protein